MTPETRGMKDTFLADFSGGHKFHHSVQYTYSFQIQTKFLIFFLRFFQCYLAYLRQPINFEKPYSRPSTDEYGL